jgi:hypothetical protein
MCTGRRMIADLVGLSDDCPVRRCQRQKRCAGAHAMCIERNAETLSERLRLILDCDVTLDFDDRPSYGDYDND